MGLLPNQDVWFLGLLLWLMTQSNWSIPISVQRKCSTPVLRRDPKWDSWFVLFSFWNRTKSTRSLNASPHANFSRGCKRIWYIALKSSDSSFLTWDLSFVDWNLLIRLRNQPSLAQFKQIHKKLRFYLLIPKKKKLNVDPPPPKTLQ